jgi:hypothetical protein
MGEHTVTEPNITQGRTATSVGPEISRQRATAGAIQTSPEDPDDRYTGFDLWLHRLTVLMFVFVCAVVGVLLVILPWRPEWTDNRLLLAYPTLRSFVAHGFVRGICSGLGILDIGVGFWEAIHYHEGKHP